MRTAHVLLQSHLPGRGDLFWLVDLLRRPDLPVIQHLSRLCDLHWNHDMCGRADLSRGLDVPGRGDLRRHD